MNQLSLVQAKLIGKILFMNYDSDSYVMEEVPTFNIKNFVIYGKHEGIELEQTEVKEVPIIEEEYTSEQVESAVEYRLSRLAQIVFRILYQNIEDTDEGDCFIVLDEVAKLKSIIEIKYQKFLKIEKYKEYLDSLYYLDKEIRNKIAVINYKNSIAEALTEGRSR